MRFLTFYCQLQEVFIWKTSDDHIKKSDIKAPKSKSFTNDAKKKSVRPKKFWREKTLKSLQFGRKQIKETAKISAHS